MINSGLTQPDRLLKPRETAEIFGVRTPTLARWAREGRLSPFLTPGGHRRYALTDVHRVAAEKRQARDETEQQRIAEDAVRLYQQGWSIRQLAGKFGVGYGVMRRILLERINLRPRGGARPTGSARFAQSHNATDVPALVPVEKQVTTREERLT